MDTKNKMNADTALDIVKSERNIVVKMLINGRIYRACLFSSYLLQKRLERYNIDSNIVAGYMLFDNMKVARHAWLHIPICNEIVDASEISNISIFGKNNIDRYKRIIEINSTMERIDYQQCKDETIILERDLASIIDGKLPDSYKDRLSELNTQIFNYTIAL